MACAAIANGPVAILLLAKHCENPGDIALPADEVERRRVIFRVMEPAFLLRLGSQHTGQVSARARLEQ